MSVKNVALCVIATAKYQRFLPALLESVRRYFLVGHHVWPIVFSDTQPPVDKIAFQPIQHRAWPGPTLYRYRDMLSARLLLQDMDGIFYCDADMQFVAPVGLEVLGDGLTATLHPGFHNRPRGAFTYEHRRESRAFVGSHEGTRYYAGGFQGGRGNDYLKAMEELAAAIDDDAARGVTAVWHDESHWNRYLIDHPPAVTLDPSYCCPEGWMIPNRKLLALDKNHAEVRSA